MRWPVIAVPLLSAVVGWAQPSAQWAVSGEFRLRAEGFQTPAPAADDRRDYVFTSARLRLNLDLASGPWRFHAAGQGVGVRELPADAAFGIGRSYYLASGGDVTPTAAGLLELSATFSRRDSTVTAGRQPYADGFETRTGLERLDDLKRARLAERLVGNWEWVVVGRRFDGAVAAVERERTNVSVFALRVLSGGINTASPLERLEAVDLFGGTATIKRGAVLRRTEVRMFEVAYRDSRPATAAASGALALHTFGVSLFGGDETNDWLGWVAVQRGEWGRASQRAWAAIGEVGHQWREATARPWLRLGAAYASGDATAAGDHRTFFNLVPTNHKWYGAMDYVAFSNLATVYAHFILAPTSRWQVELAAHHFRLAERRDGWVLGSGAFDNASLGYQQRRNFSGGSHLGDELDLTGRLQATPKLTLELGGGRFFGGEVAEASLPAAADGHFLYAQLTWRF